MHCDYQCPLKNRHVSIVSSDVDDSKVVEDVNVSSKTTSIIKDISVDSDMPNFNDGHAFYKSTS